jgi:hypothetical protein
MLLVSERRCTSKPSIRPVLKAGGQISIQWHVAFIDGKEIRIIRSQSKLFDEHLVLPLRLDVVTDFRLQP